MTTMIPIALDTETFLIGPGNVAPKFVCVSFAWREGGDQMETLLLGNHPDDGAEAAIRKVLESEQHLIVTQNGSYDWCVIARAFPDLIPAIFEALEEGRSTDTKWREKLLNLSTTGKLTTLELPDGSSRPISYSMLALAKDYLGLDLSEDKGGAGDSWRLNYNALDGWAVADYPDDARAYAIEDAVHTLEIYEAQEQRAHDSIGNTHTEAFQTASSFSLHLKTVHGSLLDAERVAEMKEAVHALVEETAAPLIEAKVLRPGTPEKVQMRAGKPVLDRKAMREAGMEIPKKPWEGVEFDPDTTKWTAEDFVDFPHLIVKRTKAKAESVDTKALKAFAWAVYEKADIPVEDRALTDSGKEVAAEGDDIGPEHLCLDAEVQKLLAPLNPVMAAYHERKALQKLVTNQLPAFDLAIEHAGPDGPIMHFNYDVLKETGRTSSYGGSSKQMLYPATNGQQVPGEVRGFDPRQCYIPRPGTCYFDVDVTALELAVVGQVTYSIFGESVHRERYNEGYDLHSYLGAQLALMSAPSVPSTDAEGVAVEFGQACRDEGIGDDPAAAYEAFLKCKTAESPEVRAFFKHYRKFAKPVGLGFPGGLGPTTMVGFAAATYDVEMTEEEAREFREMWRAVYPEMPRFFDWISSQKDDYNQGGEDAWGGISDLYTYDTPLGMTRRGATFCAAANGKVMQGPGAEAMKAADFRVSRACYDPTAGPDGGPSILLGCRPTNFVHDQIIGETGTDPELWHDQCMEVRRITIESMELILPDMKMRSDEAHLTSVWSKRSEPTFDDSGRLIPWTPSA